MNRPDGFAADLP